MVHARDDVLELLLPGVPTEVHRRAVSLTTFARLLAADAQDVRSESTAVTLDHATQVFERDGVERRSAAVRELLRAHVISASRASSFLWIGEPVSDVPELWCRLQALGGEPLPGMHVPLPGESALAVAARLLEAASGAAFGEALFDEDELALWRARHRWTAEGSRAVEAELEAGFERSAGVPVVRRAAWLAHRVEAALERGAVRRARVWLDEHKSWIAADERLAVLDQWTRVALGGTPSRAVVWKGALPLALVQWRDASPGARTFLAGREPAAADRPHVAPREDARASTRHDLGASVLAVVALLGERDDAAVRVLFHDVAVALRDRFDAWFVGRDGAARLPGAPEQRLVATASRVVWRRSEHGPARDALDPDGCEVLVLEPVCDRRGEVVGWLWLEFEHRLIPSSPDLAAAANAWRERVLDTHEKRGWSETDGERECASPLHAETILTRCFEALVDDLAMKTAQRHWWGFAVDGRRVVEVCAGGAELGPAAEPREPARARILERVLRTRGWVCFDEPAPDFSVHAAAASGAALAIEACGRVRAILALESARRRDFRAPDLERWGERATARAAEFGAADFRAWHRARYGVDVWLDSGARLAGRLAEVSTAAHCRAPIAIVGPSGAGKQVLARWLHFERHGANASVLVGLDGAPEGAHEAGREAIHPSGAASRSNAASRASAASRSKSGGAHPECFGREDTATLFLPHAENLSAQRQSEFARAFGERRAADADAPRLIATLCESPAALAARGAWSRELADVFAHLELRVAPLAARRVELPGLLAVLLARFAEREQRAAPRLADDALALLWRREWRRNVRELEAVAYRLVIAHGERDVDAPSLAAELARMGLDAPRKLSSRQAAPGWIAQALETTRHESGGINKTRAAAYLGWDPDTLVTRMRELGLDGDHPTA